MADIAKKTIPVSATSRYAWKTSNEIQQTKTKRPDTSYVFPERYSKNPFFMRNNPHPCKVKHIKGLLDYPICAVMDSSYTEGMPNLSNAMKLPATIKEEKLSEAWLDEVKRFRLRSGISDIQNKESNLETNKTTVNVKPFDDTSKICLKPTIVRPSSKSSPRNSPNTPNRSEECNSPVASNRPSTRNSSRSSSHKKIRPQSKPMKDLEEAYVRESCKATLPKNEPMTLKKIIEDNEPNVFKPEDEGLVFVYLSQILKTDDLFEVEYWLKNAPVQEKELILEMVREMVLNNRTFREGMNEITRHNDRQSRNTNECNCDQSNCFQLKDIQEINKQKNKEKEIAFLTQHFKGSILLDEEEDKNKEKLALSQRPRTGIKNQEIEQIRNCIASRQSVDVFGKPSSRKGASRGSARMYLNM